jgi:N utilization substance protein A
VREVLVDDESSEATVVVPDDQLSLAIGKEGLNARLAARLTGWKIDIQSETEFARAEADAAFGGQEEEFSGRCVALLSTGKRCPNTALPGSHYCGIPAHREIAEREAAGEDVSAEIVQPAQAEPDESEETEPVEATDDVEEPAAQATPVVETDGAAVAEAQEEREVEAAAEPEPSAESEERGEQEEEKTSAE